eukprot:CAMPEP_0181367274 /NCGR_PEP_ID=MMETSP1106-20121128/11284_1 /TAXON_ID=81844 /ORGANISM="Mantoniella antarctica, Strain SL-175" /LENGTH=299 /DNA_ID=CAMNT_0023482947 /DNA_START=789 /DNA_END=1684 /DNA_ORIENTATION=-
MNNTGAVDVLIRTVRRPGYSVVRSAATTPHVHATSPWLVTSAMVLAWTPGVLVSIRMLVNSAWYTVSTSSTKHAKHRFTRRAAWLCCAVRCVLGVALNSVEKIASSLNAFIIDMYVSTCEESCCATDANGGCPRPKLSVGSLGSTGGSPVAGSTPPAVVPSRGEKLRPRPFGPMDISLLWKLGPEPTPPLKLLPPYLASALQSGGVMSSGGGSVLSFTSNSELTVKMLLAVRDQARSHAVVVGIEEPDEPIGDGTSAVFAPQLPRLISRHRPSAEHRFAQAEPPIGAVNCIGVGVGVGV